MTPGTSGLSRGPEHSGPTAPRFPECVPILVDPAGGVTLRAHNEDDLPSIVEQANDPASQRWTTVPMPPGGYSLTDAAEFALELMPEGWVSGSTLGWAIEAEFGGRRRFCGSIDLRLQGDGVAEVGFGLHPAARGRSIMSTALRLVRDYGFDVFGLAAIRWRAQVGNWASRRVASAAGFRFDGTIRKLLSHRGQRVDGWVATITAEDPRGALPWLDTPVLRGDRLVLRPFGDGDVDRIVEACADPTTQRWLVSLPDPYDAEHARDYIEITREQAALGRCLNWCVADIATDRCLGSISLEGFGGYSRRTEIGYWAHPAARGRGLITESVRLVTKYAEKNRLTDSIMIRCARTNTASRRVAEAAGYAQIGVLPRSEPLGDHSLADLILYSRP